MSSLPKSLSRSVAFVLVLGLAATAIAGTTNPGTVMERIGSNIAEPVALLTFPGHGRALVAQRTGELRLVTGDGLVDETLFTLDVSQTCAGEGLMSAMWHYAAPGNILFVSYVSQSPRELVVERLVFTGRQLDMRDVIFTGPVPSDCTNIGGAIGWESDNTLLIAIGDGGDSAAAGQPLAPVGKIHRVGEDGSMVSGNLLPNSSVYGLGVRNPTKIVRDPASGESVFVDIGPGMNDEINPLVPLGNYGWPQGAGPLMIAGLTDPLFTFPAAPGPSALVIYREAHLGNSYDTDIIVGAGNGEVIRLDRDGTSPDVRVAETLFLQDTPSQVWMDAMASSDGYVYLLSAGGDVWRYRLADGLPTDPSQRYGIVPALVTKADASTVRLAIEREAGADNYGLYIGDLSTLRTGGYNHGVMSGMELLANEYIATPADDGNAYARIDRSMAGMPQMAYFLMSADSQSRETYLGVDYRDTFRPGGNRDKSCADPSCAARGYGVEVNECFDPFTVDWGVAEGQEIGPITVPGDFDCLVVLFALSAEWCGPCRTAARETNDHWVVHRPDGYEAVDLIYENNAGNAADQTTVWNWSVGLGLDFTVALDENYRVFQQQFGGGGCNGIPNIHLLSRGGVRTNFWCGYNGASIEAAVEAEIQR